MARTKSRTVIFATLALAVSGGAVVLATLRGGDVPARTLSRGIAEDVARPEAVAPEPAPSSMPPLEAGVYGAVVDDAGAPVAGAAVRVAPAAGEDGVTDARGRFAIACTLYGEVVQCFAEAEGYVSAAGPLLPVHGPVVDMGTLVLRRGGLDISGVAVGQDGVPLPGIPVLLDAEAPDEAWALLTEIWASDVLNSASHATVTADIESGAAEDGTFSFHDLPPGPYRLRFPGFALDHVAAGTRELRVVLPFSAAPPDFELDVTVLLPDGTPAPWAFLELRSAHAHSGEAVEGAASLPLGGVPLPLRVRASTKTLTSRFVEVPDATVRRITMRLEPAPSIRGRVFFRGEPFANAIAVAYPLNSYYDYDATTDAKGNFEIAVHEDGDFHVSVRHGDKESRGTVTRPGGDMLVLELLPRVKQGLILQAPPGETVGKCRVLFAHGVPATVTGEGSTADLTLEDLPKEPVLLLVLPERHAVTQVEFTPRRQPLVVQLERGRRVQGRVIRADGTPVAGAGVRGVFEGEWEEVVDEADPITRTGLDGSFVLRVLQDLRLTAEAPGLAMAGGPVTPSDGKVEIVLAATKALGGRVTPPAAGDAYAFHESGEFAATAVVRGDGFFRVAAPPGRYRVLVVTGDGRYAVSAPVEAGTSDLHLETLPGASVRGRVLGTDGSRRPGTRVVLWTEGCKRTVAADESGRFEFHGVPHGTHVVTAAAGTIANAVAGGDDVELRVP